MDAPMMCPRRLEGWSPVKGPDTWNDDRGVKVCSFCGSMHPEEFLVMAAAGATLGPTDKNYKVYVDLPNPQEGKRVQTGSTSGPAYDRDGKPNLPDLTFFEKLLGRYDRKVYGIAGPTMMMKFYFQHLSVEQRHRFLNLLNANSLTIGSPGYFYRMPFFIQRGRRVEGE